MFLGNVENDRETFGTIGERWERRGMSGNVGDRGTFSETTFGLREYYIVD